MGSFVDDDRLWTTFLPSVWPTIYLDHTYDIAEIP